MNTANPLMPTVAATARRSAFVLTLPVLLIAGCASGGKLGERPSYVTPTPSTSTRPTTQTTAETLFTFETFAVQAVPPDDWKQRTNSINERSEHITWLSPTGDTAYGVVFFKLPFPVGHDLAFTRGFLAEVRKREGEPEVLEKQWDEALGGLRFKVRSPMYTVEAKFFVKGLRGYCVYAGSLTAKPVNETEFAQAQRARESTRFAYEIE